MTNEKTIGDILTAIEKRIENLEDYATDLEESQEAIGNELEELRKKRDKVDELLNELLNEIDEKINDLELDSGEIANSYIEIDNELIDLKDDFEELSEKLNPER